MLHVIKWVCDLRGLTMLEREVPRLVLLRHLGRPSRSQSVTPALFVMMNTTGLNYYLSVRDPAAAGLSATAYTCAEVFPFSLSVCPPATVFQKDLHSLRRGGGTSGRDVVVRRRLPSGGGFREVVRHRRRFRHVRQDRARGSASAFLFSAIPVPRPCHTCRPTLTSLSSHSSPRAGLRVVTRAVRVRISGTAAGAEPVRNPPRRLRRHPRGRRLHRGAAHRLQRSGCQVRSFLLISV